MILVQNKYMSNDNVEDLKALSLSLVQTIKNREAMIAECKDASKEIHIQKLERYRQQKAEIDAKISNSTKPTLTK